MRRILLVGALALTLASLILTAGCDKEKIVSNTEYVHDIEYVTLPPDTIIHFDTVIVDDSVTVHDTDTILLLDTVIINNVVTVHDTVVVNHTIIDYDTVTIVQNHYDTVELVDTVTIQLATANESLAFTAMEAYVNSLVIDFINTEFGYTDGWVFYLTVHQADVVRQSATMYDLYGYIDYWTPDWSGYYPLEFGYRMTFTGTDPADPNDWVISEAPATGSSPHPGGIRIVPETTDARRPSN